MRYSGTDCALMCNAPPMQLDAQVSSGSCYNYTDLFLSLRVILHAKRSPVAIGAHSSRMARLLFALFFF